MKAFVDSRHRLEETLTRNFASFIYVSSNQAGLTVMVIFQCH